MDHKLQVDTRRLFVEIDGLHHFNPWGYGGTDEEKIAASHLKVVTRDLAREDYVMETSEKNTMIRVPMHDSAGKRYYTNQFPFDDLTEFFDRWLSGELRGVTYMIDPGMYEDRDDKRLPPSPNFQPPIKKKKIIYFYTLVCLGRMSIQLGILKFEIFFSHSGETDYKSFFCRV